MKAATKIFLVLVISLPAAASATDCGDLNTQLAMNQCALAEFQKADKKLNALYNSYRAWLEEDQKRQIKGVQLAWIKFRDSACEYESSGVKGGSVYPLILQTCLTRMTNERIRELSTLANCREGDLSCPAWK